MAHLLAMEGSKRVTLNEVHFLLQPPIWIEEAQEHDKIGEVTSRKTNLPVCSYLAKLGNLSILSSNVLANNSSNYVEITRDATTTTAAAGHPTVGLVHNVNVLSN